MTIRTAAVMPGFSSSSGFGTPTTASYVMTFCTLCGACRTCVTVPVKFCSGYASTVNSTLLPTATLPMSDSLTFVSTCICVRSVAIRNSVGVWKLAATVWPCVTLRDTTVPSTGEMMFV